MGKKCRKPADYFPHTGRRDAATHVVAGVVVVNDRVRLAGKPAQVGVVASLCRSNGGAGRPFALVVWNDGRSEMVPLGRLRKCQPEVT